MKTAFLHGKLEEEIFIHTPGGYQEFLKEEGEKIENASYLKLEKTLYGLVQAAREWWKTYIDVLKKNLGFKQF